MQWTLTPCALLKLLFSTKQSSYKGQNLLINSSFSSAFISTLVVTCCFHFIVVSRIELFNEPYLSRWTCERRATNKIMTALSAINAIRVSVCAYRNAQVKIRHFIETQHATNSRRRDATGDSCDSRPRIIIPAGCEKEWR